MTVSQLIAIMEVVLPSLYAVAATVYLARFSYGKVVAPRDTQNPVVFALGAHLLYIALEVAQKRACPLTSVRSGIIFLAVAILLIYLILEKRSRERTTGFLALPLTWLVLVTGLSMGKVESSSLVGSGEPLLHFHAALTIVGMAAMMVAAVHAALYLVLHHDLKTGRLGLAFERLPALETLEDLTLAPTRIGLFLFAGGLALGWELLGRFNMSLDADPKTLAAGGAFFAYLIAVLGAWSGRMRGRAVAVMTLIGFALLCFAAGIPFIARSFHTFS